MYTLVINLPSRMGRTRKAREGRSSRYFLVPPIQEGSGNQTMINLLYISTHTVSGKEVSAIGRGLCALVGIARTDTSREAEWM